MLCGYHFASSRDPNIFCEGSMSTILLPIDLQGEFFVVNLHSFMANIQNFSVVHHKIHTQCHRIDDIGYKTLCEIFLLPISISARISPDTPTGCRNQVVSRGLWSPHSYKHQSYYVPVAPRSTIIGQVCTVICRSTLSCFLCISISRL